MTFADNLVRLRREKGFSQEQLADLMDVSRQAVSKWEAGQTMPDLPKLVALADLFGTSLDALVRPEAVVETKPGGTVQVVTAGQTVCVLAGATVNVVPGYEYKSKHTLLGLPLVHINCGYGLRRAKGVIAIGNIATGIVALGGFGVGVVSFCGIGVGLLSLGGLALGGFAVGGVAVGLVAAGGCAIGMYAMGGAAVASRVAVGGAAAAPVSVGANADAGLVITEATKMQDVAAYLTANCPGLCPALRWLLSLGAA